MLNANAIIAHRAANRFSGAHNVAEPAKSRWQTNSMDPYKEGALRRTTGAGGHEELGADGFLHLLGHRRLTDHIVNHSKDSG